MPENPYTAANIEPGVEEPATPTSFKGRLGCLLGGVLLGLLMVALIIPATRQARPAAFRMQCSNNLKQIILALHSYQSDCGAFPPAYTVDAEGQPLHSWRTLILPYLEQQALYDSIDLSEPWNAPINAVAFETELTIYHCPMFSTPGNLTTYGALVGKEAFLAPAHARTPSEIKDDLSDTIAIVELADAMAFPWMEPRDIDPQSFIRDAGNDWRHQGTHAAFADGSVHYLSKDLATEIRQALVTINGGEEINGE